MIASKPLPHVELCGQAMVRGADSVGSDTHPQCTYHSSLAVIVRDFEMLTLRWELLGRVLDAVLRRLA
jgi:hypothetical protein